MVKDPETGEYSPWAIAVDQLPDAGPLSERDVGGKSTGVLAETLAEHTAQMGSLADDGPPIHNTGIFVVIVLHDRPDVILKDALHLGC